MKLLKENRTIIIFILILIMAIFFPLTGKDIFWTNYTIPNLKEFLTLSNGYFVPSLFTYVLTKSTILKIVTYSITFISLLIVLKNIVNQKNRVLSSIALFLIFLMDKFILKMSIVNLSNFTNCILSTLILVMFINILSKNSILKMNYILLFILGLLGTTITPATSFTCFFLTIYFILKNRNTKDNYKYPVLLFGELLGLILTIKFTIPNSFDFTYDLFHIFMPLLKGSNFIITLILSALLFMEVMKIYPRKSHILCFMSVAAISSYLFATLLSNSSIILYLTFIISEIAKYYICKNINSSTLFKTKINYIFITKLSFLLITLILGGVGVNTIFFLSILDILLIIEIYNYTFPREFLKNIWYIGVIALLLSNIYIYNDSLKRFNDMNTYIKNKLECTTTIFTIPKKYENDYIPYLLPETKKEINLYIDFYNISPYSKEPMFYLKFRE